MDLLGSLRWVVLLLSWASWLPAWGSGWWWSALGYPWCWALVVVGRHKEKFPCKSTSVEYYLTLFIYIVANLILIFFPRPILLVY